MELSRNTDIELMDVQEQLVRREPIFHRPEFGTSREAFEAMTSEAFWETGASGRRYSRNFVIDTVVERYAKGHEDRWSSEDFYCQRLAPDLYLLSYTLYQGQRITRRSTLWRNNNGHWIALYHQGTIVESPGENTPGLSHK